MCSSPEVHPQQACSDQSQPLTGLPVVCQHHRHNDDLPFFGIVEFLLTALWSLVSRSHKRTDHSSLFHSCSHAENAHRFNMHNRWNLLSTSLCTHASLMLPVTPPSMSLCPSTQGAPHLSGDRISSWQEADHPTGRRAKCETAFFWFFKFYLDLWERKSPVMLWSGWFLSCWAN